MIFAPTQFQSPFIKNCIANVPVWKRLCSMKWIQFVHVFVFSKALNQGLCELLRVNWPIRPKRLAALRCSFQFVNAPSCLGTHSANFFFQPHGNYKLSIITNSWLTQNLTLKYIFTNDADDEWNGLFLQPSFFFLTPWLKSWENWL